MPATNTTIAVPSGRSSISSSTDCAVVFASDQIVGYAPIMSGTSFPQRLGPFPQIISSTAKPGERDQIDLLVLVQGADEFHQLGPRRVDSVWKVLKHIGHAVIGGVRPGIG